MVVREDVDQEPRTVAQLESGALFGEEGMAHGQPRNVHVVARGSVTCMVFALGAPTIFAGCGATASQELDTATSAASALPGEITTALDISAYVERKIAVIAAHRTQYPIDLDMLPLTMLQEMLGHEYFVRAAWAYTLERDLLTYSIAAPMIRLNARRAERVAA